MAQLKKRMRRSQINNPVRTHTVKLEKFNPVIKPGIEIISASMQDLTHIVVRTQPRAS